jgi:hypothetical protein
MATILSKLAKKEEEREIIIKMGVKEKRLIKDSTLAKAIETTYELIKPFKELEFSLKEQKKIIADKARMFIDDKGTITFIVDTEDYGVLECKVTFQYEAVIPPKHIEEARKILGKRFDDLVRVKTTYVATQKLIELVTDADKGAELAKYITVKEKAAQISFK